MSHYMEGFSLITMASYCKVGCHYFFSFESDSNNVVGWYLVFIMMHFQRMIKECKLFFKCGVQWSIISHICRLRNKMTHICFYFNGIVNLSFYWILLICFVVSAIDLLPFYRVSQGWVVAFLFWRYLIAWSSNPNLSFI